MVLSTLNKKKREEMREMEVEVGVGVGDGLTKTSKQLHMPEQLASHVSQRGSPPGEDETMLAA